MGGLGSGGGRVGAGRKPDEARSDEPFAPVAMPEGMSEDEQAVWAALAPHALAARTLTEVTADSFRDLCELIVWRRKLLTRIEQDGLTYVKTSVDGAGVEHSELKKHPLLGEYRGLMQRVEAGRARFRLAPIGKELAPKSKDKPQSALDKLKAQSRIHAVK